MKKMSFVKMIEAVVSSNVNRVELELLRDEAKVHTTCTNIIGDYLYCHSGKFIILTVHILDGEVIANVMHGVSLSEEGHISYNTGNKLQRIGWARALLNGTCLASTTGQAPSDSVVLTAIKQLNIL